MLVFDGEFDFLKQRVVTISKEVYWPDIVT